MAMERSTLFFISLTCSWLLLLVSIAHAEEPTNLNQQIVLRNLRRARSTITHAQTLPSSPLCLHQLKNSLHLIGDAETQALSLDWEAAKPIVASAIRTNAESVCWNGAIHEVEFNPSYLASELDRHLKATQNELEITTSQPFIFDELEKSEILPPPALNNEVAAQSNRVWITFARSMVIALQDMLWVQSHTTIDGRGVNLTINGRNLVLGGVQNVIIHNIQISNIRGSDTLHIFSGSNKVWVDHITSFNGELGLASVLQGSTDVTISNCKLQNYNFNMLLGASDADSEDRSLRVTVYRNWFRDSMQRMPHCRWGVCHVVNNLYTNWGYYAIGGRANARIRSESNVFMASRAKEVTPWFESKPATFDMSARIESKNDLLLNGTTFHQFLVATRDVSPSYPSGSSPPILSTSSLPSLVEHCSGALFGGNLLRCQQI
ncbi:hypothetical protein L7F22_031518 [Adiantum nelumboides]|nr:hypothetical protein [Adiantum nelumboides]